MNNAVMVFLTVSVLQGATIAWIVDLEYHYHDVDQRDSISPRHRRNSG